VPLLFPVSSGILRFLSEDFDLPFFATDSLTVRYETMYRWLSQLASPRNVPEVPMIARVAFPMSLGLTVPRGRGLSGFALAARCVERSFCHSSSPRGCLGDLHVRLVPQLGVFQSAEGSES